jgi:hypothetical protein
MIDPIKAEVCGLSDHGANSATAAAKDPSVQLPPVENAEVGVCPIRFLDQHSPEEVATYFENHKHELPRSHEVCVRRYQSNEDQIKELDAKYGNLVSMIQGLGQKHKDYLPEDPDDAEGEIASVLSDEKVRKWASSVGAQTPAGDVAAVDQEDEEERKPHFERNLREVRVGESPSRPWGIQVPLQYLEKAASTVSSNPAQITSPTLERSQKDEPETAKKLERPVGKCPFAHGATGPSPHGPSLHEPAVSEPAVSKPAAVGPPPLPVAHTATKAAPNDKLHTLEERPPSPKDKEPNMVFNGPVFFGYGAEDVARILQRSGLRPNQ